MYLSVQNTDPELCANLIHLNCIFAFSHTPHRKSCKISLCSSVYFEIKGRDQVVFTNSISRFSPKQFKYTRSISFPIYILLKLDFNLMRVFKNCHLNLMN